MESFGRRLVSTIGANFLRVIVAHIGNLLLVPIFLHYWGSVVYGEWLVLSAAIGYLSLLDLGMQTYVVNRMCQAYTQGRLEDLHKDLHSSLCVYLVIVSVGLVGTLGLIGLLPLDCVLNLQETSPLTVAVALVFLGSNTLLISIPMGLVAGLYRATGAYTRGLMIGNALYVVQFVLTASIVWMGLSMALVAMSWFIMNLGGMIFILWELRRFRPEIEIGIHLGSLNHGWNLVGPGALFFLMAIAAAVNIQGTVLVVNSFLSGIAVVQFSTTRTLSNLISQTGNMISSALWPELTAVEARGEAGHLRRLSRSLVKFNVSLAVLASLLLRTVGPDLYRLWTRRQLDFDATLLDIFMIQMVLMAFWNSSGLVLLASNHQRVYAWWTLANALVTIALSVFLVRVWGVVGVAIASLLGDVLCCLWVVPRLACRFLDEPQSAFWTSTFIPGLAIGAVLLGLSEWLEPMFNSLISRLLLIPLLITVFYFLASYVFWMNPQERHLIRRIPQRVWGIVTA